MRRLVTHETKQWMLSARSSPLRVSATLRIPAGRSKNCPAARPAKNRHGQQFGATEQLYAVRAEQVEQAEQVGAIVRLVILLDRALCAVVACHPAQLQRLFEFAEEFVYSE